MNSKSLVALFLLGGFLSFLLMQCQNPEATTSSNLAEAREVIPDKVDFNFHVKPILSDRCFKCHGPDEKTREAGLAFHEEEFAFAALGKLKDHYAIVAGNPDSSTLIQRIYTADENDVMPPPESNLTLSEYEKEILKKWVEQGAEWKKHWAFILPTQPSIPQVKNQEWVKNEVDYFILSKLEDKEWAPAEEASKAKLLRRLSFTLTGLPPSMEQLDNFLKDDSPNAFEKVVDSMLASDAYAERMAMDWMDLARYADTHGYQDDFERLMWPWRDWVIHAFKENRPYNEFVTWQLAGDLLPDPSLEQIIATGFNRNHKITAEGGVIDEEYRVEYVADRAQTFATAFLGMTMECARCHDHKYDPLSQKNYFELYSFFNNIPEKGLVGALNRDFAIVPEPYVTISKEQMEKTVKFINNLDSLDEIRLMVMREMDKPRPAFILNRGQYDQPTEPVKASTPGAILSFEKHQKDRLGLAEWLFDEKNPLTARVAVNRLWQQVFGTGIVASTFDFGNQGNLPSHPELLDFLAIKYREEGWDTKKMLKYLVSSATFRQSSKVTDQQLVQDPENILLSRAPRLRLTAEMIRDQALQLSGLLHPEVGGPSVKPYQPEGLWKETTGGGGGSTARYIQDKGEKLYRRSLYTFWKRTVPPPSMMTFDTPSRDLCTVKRQETNTPLQALVLLNDPQIVEAARLLAHDAIQKGGEANKDRIAYMFRLVTSRTPTDEEVTLLMDYYQDMKEQYQTSPDKAQAYLAIGEYDMQSDIPESDLAAYAVVANTILNLDESISR